MIDWFVPVIFVLGRGVAIEFCTADHPSHKTFTGAVSVSSPFGFASFQMAKDQGCLVCVSLVNWLPSVYHELRFRHSLERSLACF
ncbi:hypothetical protein CPB84DRAFT_1774915 [Gymnopilus junonius]|uniref:Secreted protein n=1 Tax=Gymnopilus junonius TaxID=109634 RepID=A0A9P5NSM4_GYMJU|nr:hypothetical protein CPB84DRAFT_1774915 [Gymnopilus junonius]